MARVYRRVPSTSYSLVEVNWTNNTAQAVYDVIAKERDRLGRIIQRQYDTTGTQSGKKTGMYHRLKGAAWALEIAMRDAQKKAEGRMVE